MGDKSDEKKPKISDSDAKSKGSRELNSEPMSPGKPIASASDYVKKFFSKLYSSGSASTPNNPQSDALPNNITALLAAAEKRIKEFYEIVTSKISHFLDNDFRQLKDLSKDELTKMKASLLDYKAQLEKISQEKIVRIAEIKKQLQTRFMTADEVQNFVKYIDVRITEIKRITENIILTMSKNEVANNFAKELQSVVADYGKRVTSAMDGLYKAMKETVGDLNRSMPDKKTIMTKIPKMPTTTELQSMPSKMSKVFKKVRTFGSEVTDKPREKLTIPVSLREKLPNLNLSKHFNSETMYGRANVAKATYAAAFLTFLYWKFRDTRR